MERLFKKKCPEHILGLVQNGLIEDNDIYQTDDGFTAVSVSIASILAVKGITDFVNDEGKRRPCKYFFDDWYLYAVSEEKDTIYSLFKMREQEFDAGEGADGDIPGITVSFISFDVNTLFSCLSEPSDKNSNELNREINRVVAKRKQHHNELLKKYFLSPSSKGSYIIAQLYTSYIASISVNGVIEVPLSYAQQYAAYMSKKGRRKMGRLPKFIDENNINAGYVLCDHKEIRIQDPNAPTIYERLAILATHTANVSMHSFAAEVRFHAKFLTNLAKFPIPFGGGSIYASAVRADMTIDDKEFEGPTPYYDLDSILVRKQRKFHEGVE